MLEFLRSIKLGGLSIFGVTLPGVLLLGFVAFGFFLPLLLILTNVSGIDFALVLGFIERNELALFFLVLVLGYTLGYILRLFSPDRLDAISGQYVRRQMREEEEKVWPYTGCVGDKFPYFLTRVYLEARGLLDEANLVQWGPDSSCISATSCTFHKKLKAGGYPETLPTGKRSKTAVNGMKLDLALLNPEFAATAESNEAHIRLMFGAWLAMRWARWPMILGTVVLFLYIMSPGADAGKGTGILDSFVSPGSMWCTALLSFEVILLFGMFRISKRIESVFHYRRVGELVYVLQALIACRRGTIAAETSTEPSLPDRRVQEGLQTPSV